MDVTTMLVAIRNTYLNPEPSMMNLGLENIGFRVQSFMAGLGFRGGYRRGS